MDRRKATVMKSRFILAVHSYPGANAGVARHWPYYEKSGADKIIGIGTTDGGCRWPDGVESVEIGRNEYIANSHLPRRLLDTMRFMLLLPFDRFCIIEWDCLFFAPLPEFTGMAAFHAGNQSAGMRAKRYYHVPWCFDFDAGMSFVTKGDEMIGQVSGHECSPDVFFGWVCEAAGIEVTQPWAGFSRNSLDVPGDLELAREARRAGVVALHGCKTERDLSFILS